MAIIKAKARQTTAVERVAEGNDTYIRALRDGTLTTAAFFQMMALEGRMFVANAGTVTSPITFGASGAILGTEPDLCVEVPTGTTIMPVSLGLYMEAYGTNAIFECSAVMGTGGSRGAATGGTAITPKNMRTSGGIGSNCTIYSNIDTATATYPTANLVEFFRNGLQSAITHATAVANVANADIYKYDWSAVDSGIYPVAIGPSQIMVFAASQAGTGFITFCYVEFPSSYVS